MKSFQRQLPIICRSQFSVEMCLRRSMSSAAPQVHQTIAGRLRFYKKVDVQPVPASEVVEKSLSPSKQHYKILLDGRTLRTPGRNPLYLPNLDLAMAIALEWDAQNHGSRGIQPTTMPLMILASTAIDQIAFDPETTKITCMSYLATDTSLFFAPDEDRILLKKQRQHLQPLVRWMHKFYGIELLTTQQMSLRIQHPEASVRKIRWMLDQLDPFSLAGLQCVTMECKSLVMGLAYFSRHLSLEQARVAARLEEEFQVEVWGLVEGGHDMDRLNNSVSLSSAGLFLSLIHDDHNDFKQFLKQWQEKETI